jgi:hypothetical protein
MVLPPGGMDPLAHLDNVERRFLRLALEQAGGTKKSAARLRVATPLRGALLVRGWRCRQARRGRAWARARWPA